MNLQDNYAFVGSNFVVMDIRAEIKELQGRNFPFGWRGTKGMKQATRELEDVTCVVYHQTYGSIQPGIKGPKATAGFTTRFPKFKCITDGCENEGNKWEGNPIYPSTRCPKCAKKGRNLAVGRGFPEMPYHVFVPFNPDRTPDGKVIVYWCVSFEHCTWQGGPSNPTGVACAFQGKMRSRHLRRFRPNPGTDGLPSEAQLAVRGTLWSEWLRPTLNLSKNALHGHYMYNKPPCPGDDLEGTCRAAQQEPEVRTVPHRTRAPAVSEWFDTWPERQAALVTLGFDLGTYGPKKNGVDDDPGDVTKLAIEAFQEEQALHIDGVWDDAVEQAMIDEFKRNDLTNADLLAALPDELTDPDPTDALEYEDDE